MSKRGLSEPWPTRGVRATKPPAGLVTLVSTLVFHNSGRVQTFSSWSAFTKHTQDRRASQGSLELLKRLPLEKEGPRFSTLPSPWSRTSHNHSGNHSPPPPPPQPCRARFQGTRGIAKEWERTKIGHSTHCTPLSMLKRALDATHMVGYYPYCLKPSTHATGGGRGALVFQSRFKSQPR